MPTFKASVQYDDWSGTAAADNSDHKRIADYFKGQGNFDPDTEVMVGCSFYSGENSFSVTGYFHPKPAKSDEGHHPGLGREFEDATEPVPLTTARTHVFTPAEFLSYFKRLNVMFSPKGILTGVEYTADNE